MCQLTLFFTHAAIYFIVMFLKYKKRVMRVIGVALEGQHGLPVVVFKDSESSVFLTVSADIFDAEMLIRDFTGEDESSASAWLSVFLEKRPPQRGIVYVDKDGDSRIRLEFGTIRFKESKRNRSLTLGEGLIISRRLSLPLYADERLFEPSKNELEFLNESGAFAGNFLYLTPPQFALNIAVE